jgi:Icc-related predicted phosphoesterase
MHCLFVSDLHGRSDRYRSLFAAIREEKPALVFIAGDLFSLLPTAGADALGTPVGDLDGFILPELKRLKADLGEEYPEVFVILGNDDGAAVEESIREIEEAGLWCYMHNRKIKTHGFTVYGYNFIPPTPFQLKDWERYDVGRYVDPGCVSPEQGWRSVPVRPGETRWSTIAEDLEKMAGDDPQEKAIWVFHTPPHDTDLDRAGLDDVMVDHVPVDVHIGSIAVRKFIETRQPYLTLHGHVHESTKLTGNWRDRLGSTVMFNAAHDGAELSMIRFNLKDLSTAARELMPWRP